jgi:hypothetical protein
MKKIVRLTESDLTRLVKRVIKEQEEEEFPTYMEDMKQTAVEWLINIIDQKDWVNYTTEERLEVFRFAKEMEEQQGYSEEEVDFFVKNILHHIKYYEYNVNNLELISFSNDIEYEIEKLYEEFKNK